MFEEALASLALNIYHEACDQPFIGQVVVAQVVMNRVHDDRYPDDVCEVVTRPDILMEARLCASPLPV